MTLLGMAGWSQMLFLALLPIIALGLVLFALVDILRSEFTGSNKLIWVIVVLFFPILGAILYLAIGRDQKIS